MPTETNRPAYRAITGRYIYRGDTCIGFMLKPEDLELVVEALNDAERLARGEHLMAHRIDYGQCGNWCTRQTPCRRPTGDHWWTNLR